MEIITAPDEILNRPTQPVTKFDENLRKLVRKMEEILKNQHNPEGVGLSANQVGVNLRLAVIRLNPDEEESVPKLLAVANPEIVKRSGSALVEYEGCLSIPDQYGQVARNERVTVKFQDLSGKELTINATGFIARIFQHEVDHLEGELITEKVEGKLYTGDELEKMFQKKDGKT